VFFINENLNIRFLKNIIQISRKERRYIKKKLFIPNSKFNKKIVKKKEF